MSAEIETLQILHKDGQLANRSVDIKLGENQTVEAQEIGRCMFKNEHVKRRRAQGRKDKKGRTEKNERWPGVTGP